MNQLMSALRVEELDYGAVVLVEPRHQVLLDALEAWHLRSDEIR